MFSISKLYRRSRSTLAWTGFAAGGALALTLGALTFAGSAAASPAPAPAPNTVTARIPDENAERVAVDPANHTVWTFNTTSLIAFSETTNKPICKIVLANSPNGFTVDPSTGKVFVNLFQIGNDTHGTVEVVNASNCAEIGLITVGEGIPHEMGDDPATDTVYATNDATIGTVSVINARTDTVTASIYNNDAPEAVATDPTTDRIYIANLYNDGTFTGQGNVWVVNGQTNKVISVIPNVGDVPFNLAFDPTTKMLFTADPFSNGIGATNTSTDATTIVPVGAGIEPTDVTVDPANGMVYSANEIGSNTASVISEATDTVVATINLPDGGYPSGIAADPSIGNVYVASVQGYLFVIKAAPGS